MLGPAQRALFMVMLYINSNHTMRGEQQVKCRFPSWSLANSHDTAVHLPAGKGVFGRVRGCSWICFRHGQRQRERPSSQVVFCVVSRQRKLYSVGAIGGATACTMPRCCISHGCSCHEPAWCVRLAPCNQVMDIQNVHILKAPRGL